MISISAVGTSQQIRWVRPIVYSVLILNLLDLAFTVFSTSIGLAREKNPLLEGILANSLLLFVSTKVTLVGLGCWILLRYQNHPLSVVGIFATFLVYYWLLLHHVRHAICYAWSFYFG